MTKETALIVIRPDDIIERSSTYFSQQIISSIMSFGELDVIGLGTSIFMTCSAVNISKDIANVNIHHISLDYVDFPILGKYEVILFTLKNTPPKTTMKSLAERIDKKLNNYIGRDGQLIVVSRRQNIEKLVAMCLWKMSQFNQIKLIAGGTAINNATKIALTLAKSGIAKEPTYVKLISLEKLTRTRTEIPKPITGIAIYIEKGKEKVLDRHKKLLEQIKSQFRSL